VTCRCGDVVVVLFPFIDLKVVKPRPALVLSAQNLAMITTGKRSSWPSDIPIIDLASAGLKHPSVVRWKVFTLAAATLGPRIGRLGPADCERVAEAQKTVFVSF
jgi:mRNA interferase MazF